MGVVVDIGYRGRKDGERTSCKGKNYTRSNHLGRITHKIIESQARKTTKIIHNCWAGVRARPLCIVAYFMPWLSAVAVMLFTFHFLLFFPFVVVVLIRFPWRIAFMYVDDGIRKEKNTPRLLTQWQRYHQASFRVAFRIIHFFCVQFCREYFCSLNSGKRSVYHRFSLHMKKRKQNRGMFSFIHQSSTEPGREKERENRRFCFLNTKLIITTTITDAETPWGVQEIWINQYDDDCRRRKSLATNKWEGVL